VNDIIHHQNKSEYCLGVIVVHRDKKGEGDEAKISLDIVDGQQRLLTLSLLVFLATRRRKLKSIDSMMDITTDIS
jgi:uncharacterized protein with ParB-like and HNH nuclease domain